LRARDEVESTTHANRALVRAHGIVPTRDGTECQMKGSQKPKKLEKKPAQKTLKERRADKRGAAKPQGLGT
jgi:hypothetical protein